MSRTDIANASNNTAYTWDGRNRLTAINGPGVTASFKYDALERRAEKTVNGHTIGFVYDGAQAIGEVTGGTISTALLTGVAIDEVIARYSQTGNRTYLTDALGSVVAQAKEDQSVQNFYGYSPYGQSTSTGPDEGNPVQFTGRENDQTGLLYYRARFYDPVLKRFISEDPIGLAGGPNVYSYVDGAPINLVDPTGNASTCYSAGPDCGGAGSGIIKTPPDGSCWKAVMRGGYIIDWERCYECPKEGTPPPPSSGPPPGPPIDYTTSYDPTIPPAAITIDWDTFFPWRQKGLGGCVGPTLAKAVLIHRTIDVAGETLVRAGYAAAKKAGLIGWGITALEILVGIPKCAVSTEPNPNFIPQ